MSVQHGQVGKFKVLDLLDSAVLEHGQVGRGCRFAHLAVARSLCNLDLTLCWAAISQ